MNTALSSRKTDYLDKVSSGLADLPDEDREEVLQDLEVHLDEIADSDVVAILGPPESFVEEFRASAGLADVKQPSAVGRLLAHLEAGAIRLAELSRWQTIRPVWVWTRGWLLVSLIAILSQPVPFDRFPIPMIEFRTTWGLLFVVVATSVSLWLDRGQGALRSAGSVIFNSLAVIGVLISMFSVTALEKADNLAHVVEQPEALTDGNGEVISNIYAYDLEGSPVEVLLYDQAGRPLLNMPFWVYQEAEHDPGSELVQTPDGAVTFERDSLGRPIFNLYPLSLVDYDGRAILPPSLGFPATEATGDQGVTTTSIVFDE